MGQGHGGRRRFRQDRLSRPRRPVADAGSPGAGGAAQREVHRPVVDRLRRPGRLRLDPQCRHDRHLPDRVGGPDADGGAAEAAQPAGDGVRGGGRPPRRGRQRRCQPVHKALPGQGRVGLRPSRREEGVGAHPGHHPLPGPGERAGGRGRRFQLQGRRQPAARLRPQEQQWADRGVLGKIPGGRRREGRAGGERPEDIRQVLGPVHVPGVPRLRLRDHGLPDVLAQAAPPAGVLRGHLQPAADGLLQHRDPEGGRQTARHTGARTRTSTRAARGAR